MYTLVKVLGWIIATPFILLALFAFARFVSCGPNWEVVRVAKPVAKIIADDIVKNGIPKSLKNIEGLPYVLEGCERKEVYWDKHLKVKNKQKANWSEIFLDCNFNTNKKKYYIHIRQATNLGNTLDRDIDLKLYNKETYTGIKYYFEYSKEKNKLLLAKGFPKNPKIFDNKKTGICSQFRP